jgi:hypothetical protein
MQTKGVYVHYAASRCNNNPKTGLPDIANGTAQVCFFLFLHVLYVLYYKCPFQFSSFYISILIKKYFK